MDTTIGMPYKKNIIHLTVGKRGIFIKGKMKNICFGMVVGLLFCVSAGSIGYWFLTGQSQAESPRKTQKQQATTEEDTKTVEATAGSQAEEKRPAEETLVQEEQKTAAAKPEKSEEELFEEQIAQIMADMTVEEKVLQLFMITPEELTGTATVIRAGDTTREKLSEFPVGGLIYFSHNIQDEAQLTEMLQNTQNFQGPMFLGIDEEGGIVSRVADSGLAENVGSAADIAASGDAQAARDAGSAIGGYLSKYGFNVDFAPVADVIEEGNAFIGERSFGSDTAQTASMAAAFTEGIQGSGVSACMKHFPGIGDTTEDMHDGKVSSQKTIENFTEKDFPVYQAGIAAGVDFIMVSHLSVPGVTGDDTPCSLSEKMITEILRGQLGYQGIVITDAMDMKAVTDYYEPGEAAVKAIAAGADMILMPDDFQAAYNGVLEAVNNGTLSEARIDESLQRIFRVKLRDRVE